MDINPFENRSNSFEKKEEPKEPEKVEELKLPKVLEKEVVEESFHAKTLREHGGLESNIPINHPYWKVRP